MGPILSIRDARKSYGTFEALKGVSLDVAPGEFIALVGPSGCGKTTLLKLIAGFEEPTSGELAIDGADMAGVAPSHRPTSMVFQRLALFPHMTVAENIGFPLKLRRTPAEAMKRRLSEMLELMQLRPDYLGRYPRQLSGGEQQRVALARSMVSDPKLLLLDEPLSALDVKLKKVLQAELKRLHRSLGVTFVHVTHDLEEAMMLADRIAVMRAGLILQVGRPDDIYYRPADAFVAGFIGETNLLPIEITGRNGAGVKIRSDMLSPRAAEVPSALAAPDLGPGPASMMVRPELIAVTRPGEARDFTLEAEIAEIFIKGGTIQYRASTPQGSPIVLEIPGTSRRPAEIGERVTLGWNGADIYLFAERGS